MYYRQQGQGLFLPGTPGGFPIGGNVNARLDRLERQVDRLERQVDRLNRRLDRIERRLGLGGGGF
jgi:tetrahydromethanopterin S-methyltransferase subunit G